MSIVLAALSSVFIGTGEYVGSAASRRTRPEEVAVGFFLTGVVVAPLLVLVVDSELRADDIALGALAGVGNAVGVLWIYKAYSVSSVGVAAPLTAVITIAIPVAFDVIVAGDRPSGLTVTGVAIGVLAVALTSWSPGIGGDLRRGIRYATLSGLAFALTLTAAGSTDLASGMWPTVPQRAVALVVVVAIARATGPRILAPVGGPRRSSLCAGLFGSLGLAAFVAAAQRGSLGPVAVVGSQFAAVAVFLGFALRGERVWWWQTVGLVAAVVAVALIALGQA